MVVDFNKKGCVETTCKAIFGICDDPPPANDPAYLDFLDSEKWIAWVDNEHQKDIIFTAIDHSMVRKEIGYADLISY